MELTRHLEALRESLAAFVDHAHRAGIDARSVSAPDWTVRELIAHQGMVHRWATSLVRGEAADPEPFQQEGLVVVDPVDWLHEGGLALLDALEQAPDDLEAPVFLKDAPPPRQFWARRQCHETTIHAVDALSASVGRLPLADDTWIDRETALDGIDELLTGFAPRGKFGLRSETTTRFAVRPTDAERSWLVRTSPEPVVTERDPEEDGDVVLEGTAVQLYLALWNRSAEVDPEGFDVWRRMARVTWA